MGLHLLGTLVGLALFGLVIWVTYRNYDYDYVLGYMGVLMYISLWNSGYFKLTVIFLVYLSLRHIHNGYFMAYTVLLICITLRMYYPHWGAKVQESFLLRISAHFS